MKKVLSLVLAVMMVVGMSTVAFASFGADVTATVTDELEAVVGEQLTITGIAIVDSSDDAAPVSAAINLSKTNMDTSSTLTNVSALQFTVPNGTNAGTLKITFSAKRAAVANETLVLKDLDGKSLTITFEEGIEVVEASTSVPEVDSKAKIVGFAKDAKFAEPAALSEAGQTSELKITADMFIWDNDVVYPANAKMRASHLKDIGIRRVYQKGTTGTIKSADIKESKALVEVKTVDFYTKTSKTDVELKLSLTFKGATKATNPAPTYEYNFTIANDPEFIEEGQKEAYSFGNIYLEAEATVRDVVFQGDEDEIVFATKTVVKGQKYYFNVDSELSDDDAKIVADNPEVDSIYTVYSTNMANATVQFKNLDGEFFVYNGEGKFLGTTKDKKLPLASKYILTTDRVDFGGDEDPVEEPVEEPTEPEAPPMGGGEVEAPVNNYNPNTGL